MNILKKLPKAYFNTGFILGVFTSITVLLAVQAVAGITSSLTTTSAIVVPPTGETSFIIKYQVGGEIVVYDQTGKNVILRSRNLPNRPGPLTELRNISLATVMPPPIPSAVNATKYEYHYFTIDGGSTVCRKHRVSPSPHPYVGSC